MKLNYCLLVNFCVFSVPFIAHFIPANFLTAILMLPFHNFSETKGFFQHLLMQALKYK